MTDSAVKAAEELETCYQRTCEQVAARGLSVTRLPNAPRSMLRLQIQGPQRHWTIDVDCTSPCTNHLPAVSLREPRAMLAHVSVDGAICVTDGQGLSIDQSRHPELVAYTVLEAYDLLELSAADAASGFEEFFNELEGYWAGRVAPFQRTRSSVEVDTTSRLVNAYVEQPSGKRSCKFFTESEGATPSEFQVAKLTKTLGLYLALNQPILPPQPAETLGSKFVDRVIAAFGPTEKKLWRQLVSNLPAELGRLVCMLVSVPRAAGGRSLIGLTFSIRGSQVDAGAVVRPLKVLRHTATYMRERGGARNSLATKNIAVLGCGSVGSEVADALASSGIGRLTLVDWDEMAEDNVFRHALGRDSIGQAKVAALRSELLRKYPGVDIHSLPVSAESWLKTTDFSKVDGIVVAVGQPTLERTLARTLRGAGATLPLVFTWLEPLDLGGHSFLFSANGKGCLDCIYRDDEGAASLYSRVTFLAPRQRVTRNLTGCSSIFVPYGAIQSRRTALMATEQMLRALDGGPSHSYDYWVGAGTAAQKEGFATTRWWDQAKSSKPEDAARHLFSHPCTTCRDAK